MVSLPDPRVLRSTTDASLTLQESSSLTATQLSIVFSIYKLTTNDCFRTSYSYPWNILQSHNHKALDC